MLFPGGRAVRAGAIWVEIEVVFVEAVIVIILASAASEQVAERKSGGAGLVLGGHVVKAIGQREEPIAIVRVALQRGRLAHDSRQFPILVVPPVIAQLQEG